MWPRIQFSDTPTPVEAMSLALTAERTQLGRGFAPINATTRRFATRKQFQSITGAEITTTVSFDIMMHKAREENISKYPVDQVMGNNIGHDYEYVGVHDNDPIFATKEPTRSARRIRGDAEWGQGFSSMAGYHFGRVKTQEQLKERIRFVGFATGAVSWQNGRLPAPASVAVRIAGAGTAEFTGNDIIEPGQLVTYEPFSINDATRKLQLQSLPPTQLRPKEKLVPILRTMRPEELVDFIGDSAAESFFVDGKRVVHGNRGFAVLLDPDYMDSLENYKQLMLDVRNFSAVQGFVHILTAAQAGLVTINRAIAGSDAEVGAAVATAQNVFKEPIVLNPQVVKALARMHGLTGTASPATDYLDVAFARGFRGVLPLEAHETVRNASDLSGVLGTPAELKGFNAERDWANEANVIMGLVQHASHSLYNSTTSAYWEKRSTAIAMATTAAGPGERFNYLLLIS